MQSDMSEVTRKLVAKQSLESSYFIFFVVLSSAGNIKALVSIWTCTLEIPWELKSADAWVPSTLRCCSDLVSVECGLGI